MKYSEKTFLVEFRYILILYTRPMGHFFPIYFSKFILYAIKYITLIVKVRNVFELK